MASTYTVDVYIYDVTKGLARSLSAMILGKQIEGVWHTGVVVYGQEFTFGGGGIMSNPPSGTLLGSPDTVHHAGTTEIPYEIFLDFLQELSSTTFRDDVKDVSDINPFSTNGRIHIQPECYNLFKWNCNTFSNEVVNFLTGQTIPSYVIDLPNEVLSSPAGGALRNLMESMMGAGGPEVGGQTMFSNSTSSSSVDGATGGSTATASAQSNHSNKKSDQSERSAKSADQSSTKDLKFPPVAVFEDKEILQDFRQKRSEIEKALEKVNATNQMQLLDEVVEYLDAIGSSGSNAACDWALGPKHIETLVNITLNDVHSTYTRELTARLLLNLSRFNDIITLCVHDRGQNLTKLLRSYEQFSADLLSTVLKSLSNFLRLQTSLDWFVSLNKNDAMSGANPLSSSLSAYCLLHEDKRISNLATCITSRCVTSEKFNGEMALDVGIAVIQVLKSLEESQDEVSASLLNKYQHLWFSLNKCCTLNPEVLALLHTMEVDVEEATKKHPEIVPYTSTLLA